jgi:hypothetical protein
MLLAVVLRTAGSAQDKPDFMLVITTTDRDAVSASRSNTLMHRRST